MRAKKILIADDEPNIVVSLEFLMKQKGYVVKVVTNGEEVLQAVAEFGPDLILLDVMMPGEDGFAVAERIRDDPGLAGVRVLFLTARADVGDHERSRSTGAVGHVTKPFNPSSLGDEVRAALTR